MGEKKSANALFFYQFVTAYSTQWQRDEFENEKVISQFVGTIKCCDQSGERVSKKNKSYDICGILSFYIVLLKV